MLLSPAFQPLRQLNQRLRGPAPKAGALMAHFRDKAAERGYTLSDGQCRVIHCMAEQLAARTTAATQPVPARLGWPRQELAARRLLPGGAGGQKRRLHFHDFFARLHRGMHHHRALDDAHGATLDELVGDVQVLCFDEFHVHDIGDAMLLTRLFNALFARGVFLLVTSNYAPEGLLPNPLYHERFLPVIRLINSRCRCSKWVATPIFAACRPTASISVLPRGVMSGRECGAAPGP
jgi:cell division protein ZapE